MAKSPMLKSSKPKSGYKQVSSKVNGERSYKDRNLMGVSAEKEQFEPTDADPIPQHTKMAGC